MAVKITLCTEKEKNGKKFHIVNFVDDNGRAGNFVCSPAYMEKILAANPDSLAIGNNRETRRDFLYVKK